MATASEPKMPRYRQIADALQTELETPGRDSSEPLPGERILAKRFDVAPTTIRNAVAELRARGLVDVKHGSGVYLRTWHPILRHASRRLAHEQWGTGKPIWGADLGDRVVVPDRVKVTTGEAPAWVAEILETSSVVVRFRRYVVEGRPVQLAWSYLPAAAVAGSAIERLDTGPGGTYARLEELGFGPVRFSERVASRLVTPDEQRLLEVGPGHPVAAIQRQAFTASGQVIEVNVMVLDGEAYVMQWDFTA